MKEIKLTQGHVTIVDDEWFDMLSSINCHSKVMGDFVYAAAMKSERIHRVIMDAPKGMVVDHINGNTLDNRKENLRICTRSQNQQNQFSRSRGETSKYKGVCWCRTWKKWKVKISHNYKIQNLGSFDNEIEAAITYNEAAKRLHGEFANLNAIPKQALAKLGGE